MTERGDPLILGHQFVLLVASAPTAVGIRRAGNLRAIQFQGIKEKEKIEGVKKQEWDSFGCANQLVKE